MQLELTSKGGQDLNGVQEVDLACTCSISQPIVKKLDEYFRENSIWNTPWWWQQGGS